MRTERAFLIIFVMLGVANRAQAELLSPSVSVAGRTQNEWAEAWWNWTLSFPEASNPVTDTTGAFANLGDQGKVFFLAGHFGGAGPVTRRATVRRNQYLFLPLANGVTTVLDSSYGPSYDEMRQDVIEFVGEGSGFYAELDGTSLAGGRDLNDWLQLSPDVFTLEFPPGGIFTGGDYTGPIDSVQRGWWLMLAPLEVGTYTLRFGGMATPTGIYSDFDPNVQDVTYILTVVPEPSSLALSASALGLAGVVALMRGRRPVSV
ncbi:PEP-CTERM sorting domain-containing protein [Tautonia rosea]|uniref:PEP-CTERM sorting domain-containing protein n=1 Tax=Tautonia rosea TaxID=2728037 RepID=UPI001475D9E1|nr:PEP-CTERM sorting domain-containing protein [Tautonia rosea]